MLVKSEAEMDAILQDETVEVQDVHKLTGHISRVVVKCKNEEPKQAPTNNLVIAGFVTSYARLHLYSFMEKVATTLIYVDTG